jgi:hypothetical protein
MAVDEDDPTAAVVAAGDAAEPSALATPSSKARAKSSRWEDDSDTEEADGSTAAAVDGSSAAAAAADRPKKKARLADGVALDAFDAESLLAGVNQELELLDAAEGSSAQGPAAAGTAAGGAAAAAGGFRAGRAGSGPLGGAGNSSGSSGGQLRLSGILKKHGTPNSRCKKVRVRWPDLSDQEEQQGFRIGAQVKPVSAWGGLCGVGCCGVLGGLAATRQAGCVW